MIHLPQMYAQGPLTSTFSNHVMLKFALEDLSLPEGHITIKPLHPHQSYTPLSLQFECVSVKMTYGSRSLEKGALPSTMLFRH
jgi:hypothetical protein